MVTVKVTLRRRVGFPDGCLVLNRGFFSTWQWVTVFVHVRNRHRSAFDAWLWRWQRFILGVDVDHVADPGYDGATWRRGTRPHPGKGVSFKFPLGRRVAGTDWFVTLHGRQFTTRQRVTVFIHVDHVDRTALNGWRDVLFVNVDHVLDAIRHFPSCGCRTLVHPDEVVVIKVTDVGRVWRVNGLVGGKERRPFPTWQFNRLAIDVGDVLNINVPSLRNRILFVNVDDVFRTFRHLAISRV